MLKWMIAAVVAVMPVGARAGDYPERPIQLVLGFGAGGPTDIPARFIADRLGTMLGQRVLVENKPAAGGLIATRDVIKQKPDGYTLLLCTHFESINTVVYKNPGFQLSDLAPVSLIARYYYGLAVANDVPATDSRASSPTPRRIPARSPTRRSAAARRSRSWRASCRS